MPTAAAKDKVRVVTRYIILERFTVPASTSETAGSGTPSPGPAWREIGEQDSTSGDRGALRAQFPDGPPVGRKFVAVPKRSFRVRSAEERKIENPVVFV